MKLLGRCKDFVALIKCRADDNDDDIDKAFHYRASNTFLPSINSKRHVHKYIGWKTRK